MDKSDRRRVLIVEDASGVAQMYRDLLRNSGCFVVTCSGGAEVESLINSGERFDLVVTDIVLPPEDSEKYTLDECQTTGLRLIKKMIDRNVCHRFYVITVCKDVRQQVETICEKSALLLFKYKLDNEPDEFVNNINRLLEMSPPGSDRPHLVLELSEHIEVIEAYATMVDSLSRNDTEKLMSSMKWIQRALSEQCPIAFVSLLEQAETVLETQYLPKLQGTLRRNVKTTLGAIRDCLEQYGL